MSETYKKLNGKFNNQTFLKLWDLLDTLFYVKKYLGHKIDSSTTKLMTQHFLFDVYER